MHHNLWISVFVLAALSFVLAYSLYRLSLCHRQLFDRTKEIETAERLLKITEELSQKNTSLNLAAKAGHIGIWTWNVETNELLWNEQMYEMYGISKGTTVNYNTWRDKVHPDDVARAEKLLQDSAVGKATFDTEFRIILSNGDIRYIKADSNIEQNAQGDAIMVTGANIDITKQKEDMNRLALEKNKLNNILTATNVGIFEWDFQTDHLECNEIWANMLGFQLQELIPITLVIWKNLLHPDDAKKSAKLLEKHFVRELPGYDCELRMKHKNGQWIWVHVIGKVSKWTTDNKPMLMFGTQQEITLKKSLEEKIFQQANFDSLTGLASRRLAEERLKLTLDMASRSRQCVGLLFMDLNGLKNVNDTLGHDAGDYLLQEAARRISACTRVTDTVARFGGDEYVVVLSDVKSQENAEMVAKNIIQKIEEPVIIKDKLFKIGVCIGIAIYPDHTTVQSELLHLADNAMYVVKKTGRSGYLLAS